MATIVKEAVDEISSWLYNEEVKEIQRECDKLSFVERYIDSRNFVSKYNIEVLNEYFTESDTINASTLEAELSGKKLGIFERIKNNVYELIKKIASVFKALFNWVTRNKGTADAVADTLAKIEFTDEQAKKLADMLKKSADRHGIAPGSHAMNMEFKCKYPNSVDSITKDIIDRYLPIAISNDTIYVLPANAKMAVVSFDELTEFLDEFVEISRMIGGGSNSTNVSTNIMTKISELTSRMSSASNKYKNDGVPITFDPDKMSTYCDQYNRQLDELRKQIRDDDEKAHTVWKSEGIWPMSSMLIQLVSSVVTISFGILDFRAGILNRIRGIVDIPFEGPVDEQHLRHQMTELEQKMASLVGGSSGMMVLAHMIEADPTGGKMYRDSYQRKRLELQKRMEEWQGLVRLAKKLPEDAQRRLLRDTESITQCQELLDKEIELTSYLGNQ